MNNTNYASIQIQNPDDNQDNQCKDFNTQLRIGFIRKVYGILTIQLLFTVFMCALTFIPSVNAFYKRNLIIFWICLVLSIVIVIPLVCFQEIARKVPLNYFLLGGFTFCEVYMVSTLCCFYSPKIVITAAALTAAVVVALTAYACTTKTDFTFMGGLLFVGSILLLCLGILCFFLPFLHILYCILGVFLYSLYLIYDTQLIMGKFGNEYKIDDYIIAALNVYLDIINIFINLLGLFR